LAGIAAGDVPSRGAPESATWKEEYCEGDMHELSANCEHVRTSTAPAPHADLHGAQQLCAHPMSGDTPKDPAAHV
jgi:hypothetical protein